MDVGAWRAEAAGDEAFEQVGFAFQPAFGLALLHPLLHALLYAFFDADSFYRGDVGHGAVPFQLYDVLPELVL